MNNHKISKFVLLLTLACNVSRGQTCLELEQRIVPIFNSLVEGNEANAIEQSENIIDELELASALPDFFSYPFESVRIFKPVSSDGSLRVFTWNYLKEDGTPIYFGCLFHKPKKKESPILIRFNYKPSTLPKWETKVYADEKWPGAIYYALAPMKKGRKEAYAYALLGFNAKDNLSNYKLIEILTINGSNCKFGGNLFDIKDKNPKRMIFEYGDQVICSLKYYEKAQTIVVDHLAPRESIYEGFYPEYGPDGSYDGFKLEEGKWKYYPIIDVAPFVDGQRVPFNNPRP
jgi:hypothetical protein